MSLSKKDLNLNGPFLISNNELIACVIYEAMKCKTHSTIPRKVEVIIDKVRTLYFETFERISDTFYLKSFENYKTLLDWISEYIMTIQEIRELNLSRTEAEAGVGVDDATRGKYVFCSTGSPSPLEGEDFIDLDAYARNLAHDLIRSCIEVNFSTF